MWFGYGKIGSIKKFLGINNYDNIYPTRGFRIRLHFPYADYNKVSDILGDEYATDVIRGIIKFFILNPRWCKSSELETFVFNCLKPKYRVVKYLGTEYHKIKNTLYTILEVFIKHQIIETKDGDGWKYPFLILRIKGMWHLKFDALGPLFFNA